MVYFNTSTQTPEERRVEATRILRILEEVDLDQMAEYERNFVQGQYLDEDQPVSPKQLFWLRDLKEKYL